MDSYRLATRAAFDRMVGVRRFLWRLSDYPIAAAAAVAVLLAALGNVLFQRQHHGRARQGNSVASPVKENWLQRIKQWRLVKFSLLVMERTLGLVESAVTPIVPGLPLIVYPSYTKRSPPRSEVVCKDGHDRLSINDEVKKICFQSNSSYGGSRTPKSFLEENAQGLYWTPVSATSENVFEHSCVSMMNDLSLNTNSTPVRDIRRKMAFKIRSWRELIRNLDGTPCLAEKTPMDHSPVGWMDSVRHWMIHWFLPTPLLQLEGESSRRKRKRLDCYDDDLALYIPHYKGQSRQQQLGPVPQIEGLSAVPIIGNWYSPVVERPPQGLTSLVAEDEHETYEIIQMDEVESPTDSV